LTIVTLAACSTSPESAPSNPRGPGTSGRGISGSSSRQGTGSIAGSPSTSGTSGATSSAGATGSVGAWSSSGGTSSSSGGSDGGIVQEAGVIGPWPPSSTFSNPPIWQDLPDDEIINVGGTYYYTASTMHYSPGAPILRSWDLVNWEYVGHAVPVLNFPGLGDNQNYNLGGGQAYIKGIWASTLHHRSSNQTWYWMGCVEFNKTYVYTAPAAEGPWTQASTINNCYYDCGYLQDYDNDASDTMYVAYGGGNTKNVAQLSTDYLSQVSTQQVYSNTAITLEGSHFFKYNNYYYITTDQPASAEYVLRSTSPFGPYTSQTLINGNAGPISGGDTPHQGSFIQTQNGDWYYMAFQDAEPGGRIPVLAPVTWSADGWPSVTLSSSKAWQASYPYPNVPRPPQATPPDTGLQTFGGTTLPPDWEFNHNPDTTKFTVDNGVTLRTATVTQDLYSARNTLTHRSIGPKSTGTVQLDISGMRDGDLAGLAVLRDLSAYIAIKKSGTTTSAVMVNGLSMNQTTWATTSTGTQQASAAMSGTSVWLRVGGGFGAGASQQVTFFFSTDGKTFTPLGPAYTMGNSWQFYPGYRYAIFNFATTALGGSVVVKSFSLTTP
jgi:beta-xylosidase